MDQQGRINVGRTLVRILRVERGGVEPSAEEVERLLDEDRDFRWLAENWPKEQRVALTPRIGADAESLDELRDESARLQIYDAHLAQRVRYEILVSGTVILLLWPALSAALDSGDFEGYPLALQTAIVAIVLGVGTFFAWGIATPSSREDFYKIVKPDLPRRRWFALLSLAGLLLVIVMFATLGFAGLSELLYLHGIAETTPADALDDPLFDSAVYYLWGFLNAVEIPQTLGWELDVRFTDRLSPVLLLAYKLAVILPAIAMGRLAWKARRVSRT